jgi:hypothetical protein
VPANRTAALGGILTAIAAALASLLGAVHNDIAAAAVIGVAIVAIAAVVIVFLIGSQKSEALHASDQAGDAEDPLTAIFPATTDPHPDQGDAGHAAVS